MPDVPAVTGVLAVAGALALSPVLAGWTVALIADERGHWWRWQWVGLGPWLRTALVAVVFAAVAAAAHPALAWWVLAVIGAVLTVVDWHTHRLPARLVAPLAAVEAVILAASSLDEPHRFLRAALAAAAVGAVYFAVVLISPSSMGMGDVYVAAITAGLLGWSGWSQVLAGQVAVWLLAPIVLGLVALSRPGQRGRRMHIPLGPALFAGALLVAGLR
ncbi:MAG: prepilin peptidase [Actinomycetota bacterium]|nr:prepilin peptidase [Actinomycetota bacterium]